MTANNQKNPTPALAPATRERVYAAAWTIDRELVALHSLCEGYDLEAVEHIDIAEESESEEGDFRRRLEASLASISTADSEIIFALGDEGEAGEAAERLAQTLPRCREAVATGANSIRYNVNRIIFVLDIDDSVYDRRVAAAKAERARDDITYYCDRILEALSRTKNELQSAMKHREPARRCGTTRRSRGEASLSGP